MGTKLKRQHNSFTGLGAAFVDPHGDECVLIAPDITTLRKFAKLMNETVDEEKCGEVTVNKDAIKRKR